MLFGKKLTIFMLGALLVLSGCATEQNASGSGQSQAAVGASGQEKPLKKVVLRLKWINQAQFAGFYAAKDKGFYKEAGLDVEIRPGGADFPSVQMVASGSEDFGVTGADQILLSREKGVPVVGLSVIYRNSPFVLFSLKDSGITSMKDLAGNKIGVKLGGNEELTYRAMVKSSGIDGSKVQEMPVKYDLSPLLSGQVKAWPGYVINEVLSVKEQGKDVNIISPADYGINFYADALFTRKEIIDKNPEMVKSFVQASMKGWEYAMKNPEDAAKITLQYGKDLNLDHETNMMKASIPLLQPEKLPLGKMELDSWSSLQDSLIDLKFLKEKQKLEDTFTNQFLE
jgi:NitT/TauT family transport system substrate-binding protein